jgi:hypothetical protein
MASEEVAAGHRAPPSVWSGLAAGALSGMMARCVIHPADTLKAQLQVQGALRAAPVYRSTLDAISKVTITPCSLCSPATE